MNGSTLQSAFILLPGGAKAVYTSAGLNRYRHSDWLGSARLTSSPTRTVLSTTAYAPFGETYSQSGTADPSFTGQNADTVAGDYDFLAREYSTQGRWPSPDPAGLGATNPANPQSWNRYAYVLNEPLGLTDPSGLYWQCWTVQVEGGETTGGCDWFPDPIPPPLPTCPSGMTCGPTGPTGGGGGGPVTIMRAGDPNAKKDYCSHQSDQAALEELLPGITRGDYVSTAKQVSTETGAHIALEAAGGSTILLRAIRSKLGVPMSITSKIAERAAIALLLYSGYESLRAAQVEYKACMND